MAEVVNWIALPMMVVAITGCSMGANETQSDRVTLEGRDPRILVHHHSDFGMEALLTGRLVFNATNKCLAVQNTAEPPSRKTVILLWPQDTRPLIQNNKRGVQLGNGLILLEGAEVKIAGGYVDWNNSTPPGLKVPSECVGDAADSAIFEVNPFTPGG
ncbi:hypothetical protein [Nonomuraea sp. NEAU-A123]|uniref:hypothetical protein n=1 Tax=Nonomuraea sp. NEAU-A123 TaxID=2839649 RepID=UPI001BE43B95|nr:hypothetical protein [Nonomuraea sp. NEAU-A123]MBT2233761.1 hypothetical protein [Nonomuraea sp. NEAU-A123]